MTTMRLALARISPRRCEIRITTDPPPATKRRTKIEKLAGDHGVERRGRLVEDDEAQRRIGDGEGAGDLDHLPARDREVADDVARGDAVAGKDLVELVE